MSWPRKNDGARLYLDRSEGAYLLVFPDSEHGWRGSRAGIEAVANALNGPESSLCGCNVSAGWLFDWGRKRVAWGDLPAEWQAAFRDYMRPMFEGDAEFVPESIRGLWRMGEQPAPQIA